MTFSESGLNDLSFLADRLKGLPLLIEQLKSVNSLDNAIVEKQKELKATQDQVSQVKKDLAEVFLKKTAVDDEIAKAKQDFQKASETVLEDRRKALDLLATEVAGMRQKALSDLLTERTALEKEINDLVLSRNKALQETALQEQRLQSVKEQLKKIKEQV